MQTLGRIPRMLLLLFLLLLLILSMVYSQDGMKSDSVGALHRLSESLQKTSSENENFNELLVSA